MDATQHGVHDYQFSVMSKAPGKLLDYETKLSDEALLAPMGVFFPSSFCLPDNRHLMAGSKLSTIRQCKPMFTVYSETYSLERIFFLCKEVSFISKLNVQV